MRAAACGEGNPPRAWWALLRARSSMIMRRPTQARAPAPARLPPAAHLVQAALRAEDGGARVIPARHLAPGPAGTFVQLRVRAVRGVHARMGLSHAVDACVGASGSRGRGPCWGQALGGGGAGRGWPHACTHGLPCSVAAAQCTPMHLAAASWRYCGLGRWLGCAGAGGSARGAGGCKRCLRAAHCACGHCLRADRSRWLIDLASEHTRAHTHVHAHARARTHVHARTH